MKYALYRMKEGKAVYWNSFAGWVVAFEGAEFFQPEEAFKAVHSLSQRGFQMKWEFLSMEDYDAMMNQGHAYRRKN